MEKVLQRGSRKPKGELRKCSSLRLNYRRVLKKNLNQQLENLMYEERSKKMVEMHMRQEPFLISSDNTRPEEHVEAQEQEVQMLQTELETWQAKVADLQKELMTAEHNSASLLLVHLLKFGAQTVCSFQARHGMANLRRQMCSPLYHFGVPLLQSAHNMCQGFRPDGATFAGLPAACSIYASVRNVGYLHAWFRNVQVQGLVLINTRRGVKITSAAGREGLSNIASLML